MQSEEVIKCEDYKEAMNISSQSAVTYKHELLPESYFLAAKKIIINEQITKEYLIDPANHFPCQLSGRNYEGVFSIFRRVIVDLFCVATK